MMDVLDANRLIVKMHDSTKKMSTMRNGSVYVWGERSPHIHIYPSLLLEGRFSVHSCKVLQGCGGDL